MSKPPLGPILSATFVSPDPDLSADAYVDCLDQIIVDRSPVSKELADSWGAPAVAGRQCVLLRPRSAEPGWIRIVQGERAPQPFTTFGWLAIEILVKDTDTLSHQLKGTPFREIGAPEDLGMVKGVRAMQAVGEAGEVLYLTQRDEVQGFLCRHVMGDVDRIFIVVLGAPDFGRAKAFYEDHFSVSIGVDVTTAQSLKAEALGISSSDEHRMLTFVLAGDQEVAGKIQLDEHPAQAGVSQRHPGDLPGGVALVTFEVPSFEQLALPFIQPPRRFDHPPYDGRLVATCVGAAGELIELAARNGV